MPLQALGGTEDLEFSTERSYVRRSGATDETVNLSKPKR